MPRNAATIKQMSRTDRPLDNAKPRKGGFRPSETVRCNKCGKPLDKFELKLPAHVAGPYTIRYCYGCLAAINAYRLAHRMEAL